MARTALTILTPKGPYPGPVSANDLDYAYEAADVANKNKFAFTGRELILVKNDDVGAQTITLTSAPDPQQRSADITTYSVGAGEFAMFWAGNTVGWNQSGAAFHLEASDANVKFAIVRMP